MIAQAIHRRRAHVVNDLYPVRGPMGAQALFADLLGMPEASDTATDAGFHVDEDRAFNLSAVWCGVNVVGGTLASMPLIVYRRKFKGTRRGKERAPDHPMYPIVHDRFCEECGKQSFVESRLGHAMTWGNGYGEVDWDRKGQTVGAVYPVRADRVTPKRIEERDVGRPIIGWDGRTRAAQLNMMAYEIADRRGEKTLFHHKRILHIHGLGFDGIQGYSVIRRAKETAGINLAAQAHYSKFLGKRAMPAGVMTLARPANKQKKDRLKADWDEQFSGPTGRQGIAVLEGDSKFHQLLISPQDAQHLEMCRWTLEEWARWLLVPIHKLRDVTNSKTRSNIEAENRSFVEDTLRPWARRIEEEINYKMFRGDEREEYFVEFLFDDLLRGATKDRAESHYRAIQGAWATPNEIRAMENLNPIEGGDNLYVPLNMATLNDDGVIVVPERGASGETEDSDVGGEELRRATDDFTKRLVADGVPVKARGAEPVVEAEDQAEVERGGALAARQASVALFKPLMVDARRRMLQKEAKGLERGRKRLKSKGEEAFLEWATKFYDDHASFVATTVRPVFDVAIAHEAGVIGTRLPEETLDALSATYSGWYAKALALSGKKQCVNADYLPDIADGGRAAVDLNRLLNAATVAICHQVDGAKVQWLAADDCTHDCAALDGKSAEPGEPFAEPGAVKITHPPLTDGCRCIVIGVLP